MSNKKGCSDPFLLLNLPAAPNLRPENARRDEKSIILPKRDETEQKNSWRFLATKHHLLCLCSLLVDFLFRRSSSLPSAAFFLSCIFHVPTNTIDSSCFFLLSPAKSQSEIFIYFHWNVLAIAKVWDENVASCMLPAKSQTWWTIELTKLQFLQKWQIPVQVKASYHKN